MKSAFAKRCSSEILRIFRNHGESNTMPSKESPAGFRRIVNRGSFRVLCSRPRKSQPRLNYPKWPPLVKRHEQLREIIINPLSFIHVYMFDVRFPVCVLTFG